MGMMQQKVHSPEEVKKIIKSVETSLSSNTTGCADGSGATKNVAGDLYSGGKKKR